MADLRNLGQALLTLAARRPQPVLLLHTGLELPGLASELQVCAREAEASFEAFIEHHSRTAGYDRSHEAAVQSVVPACFGRLLRGRSATAITNMLRLWQVLETYCRFTDHAEGRTLYEDGRHYRELCNIFLKNTKGIGIAFHPVEFLHPPATRLQTAQYSVSPYPPMLQNNRQLVGPWAKRPAEVNGFVADVSLWGVECEGDPELNTRTTLSCWWR